MEVTWNPVGLIGVASMLFAWAMSFMVYRAAPGRQQNRRLALGLFLEGFIGLSSGFQYFLPSEADAYWLKSVALIIIIGGPAAILLLVATLETPLVRPLRNPWVSRALYGWLAVTPVLYLMQPEKFIAGTFPNPPGPYAGWITPWETIPGLWYRGASILLGVSLIVSVVAGISCYRQAPPGSATKERAKYFMMAFVTRDVLYALVFLVIFPLRVGNPGSIWAALFAQVPLVPAVFVAISAYGILKSQLFDIDLRIKRTLKRSTVAAAFLAIFFVVSETAATFFSDTLGTYLGIASAGVLVFTIAPLQRLAERVADTAMPQVQATPQYVTFKKLEVYKAAVESALELDGTISSRERETFQRLRVKLGIATEDAAAIEAEAMERFTPPRVEATAA